MSDELTLRPFTAPVDATVAVPGSKSITNRALVCAALARGVTRLDGALRADDTAAMVGCLRALGVRIDESADGTELYVHGNGGVLAAGPVTLDARLSGTTSRFVAPLLALGSGAYTLDAAGHMRNRPMADLVGALRAMGVDVLDANGGHLPITVTAGHVPAAAELTVAGDTSSQFLSGLLLSAPCLPGGLSVAVSSTLVSRPYVDMTLAVMRQFGAIVEEVSPGRFRVDPTGYEALADYRIEPDASAASYFLAAAAITGGHVRVDGLGRHSTQGDVQFADILGRMGATVVVADDHIDLRADGPLRGIEVDMTECSDTAQTLAAVAVFAEGPTRVTGIGFIRGKETDRIGAVVAELNRCGITATEELDGFVVQPGWPVPAAVRTYRDHRMAMSFALLGLRAEGITILDPGCVDKTFPEYFDVLERLRTGGHR